MSHGQRYDELSRPSYPDRWAQPRLPVVLFVRFRTGVVGESRRSVHIVPVPGQDTFDQLTAYCGQTFRTGEAELVDTNLGSMPCELCVLRAPSPGS
jgi:hypothetical protein